MELFSFGRRSAWHTLAAAVALPFSQGWADTGLIARDDDWSRVAGVVAHRGDGLTTSAGADPRLVVADGSGTPVDVNANEPDPLAVGLAAGVAEFELGDPVVALQGSATAATPHLVLALDTRGRSGVTVRYRLRDVDASSIANAVQPVALQYRVGAAGDFAEVPGAFVADATGGPGQATLVTPVTAVLPAAADDQPLVQLRVITTNASGQDEWVGIDDIEVGASGEACGQPPAAGQPLPGGPSSPAPAPAPVRPVAPPTRSGPRRPAPRPPRPVPAPPALSGMTLSPSVFAAAKKGSTLTRSPRTGSSTSHRRGASVSFRLSRPATVRFRVLRLVVAAHLGLRSDSDRARLPHVEIADQERGRFSVRGRRGLNRFRFSGRLGGRPLASGAYRLVAVAIDRAGRASAPESVVFRIR
jgi:hypothetical protein